MSVRADILVLSLAYGLLGGLLLLAVTRARLAFGLKAGAIVLTSVFYIVAFYKTQGLLGWSTPEPLPPRFQLLWARSVEPDIVHNSPGAIHLWIEELDEANLPSGVPRAYRLPYTETLARKAAAARSEIVAGRPQGGRAEDMGFGGSQILTGQTGKVPQTRAESGGDASGGGLLDPAFFGGDAKSIEFAPLPVPSPPPKDEP